MSERKVHTVLQAISFLLLVWLVNQLADRVNFKLDLTEEKRYTISEATKRLLSSSNEEVTFEVYLDGDLPPNFERFKKSIAEMLERFEEESSGKVQFKFTDPAQAGSTQARNAFFQSLMEKGLQPTRLNYSKDGDKLQKMIFPSAIAASGINEIPVNLLKGNRSTSPDEILNQSIEGLEYELAAAIAQLTDGGTKRIALITGHGAPNGEELAGFKNAILNKYNLYETNLDGRKELLGYDVVIVGKPRTAFTEPEKYVLDQYLMKGGSLVFFLDALSVNIDSALGEGTVAIPYETNLTDQLFKYGVRINKDLVLDVNSGQLPIVSGNFGNQPQIQMIPWPFFPVIANYSKHPAVRNLDAVMVRFASSIDTVKAVGITKTPLLSSTQYSKVLGPPVRVALNDLQDELREELFTDGVQNLGYLLEGRFTSLYANRLVPKGFENSEFIEKGNPGKVIVISDGDLIINEFDPETREPLALGVEAFTKTTFANQSLILNVLDYLVDDSGLIATRSRELKIRPLDRVKVKQEKSWWQALNLVVPIILVLILGIFKWVLRRKTFASDHE
ncbi:MAG: gliding motility-associated ABC transporter substrate-binding protein GldG [Bacteroidota bacterium]